MTEMTSTRTSLRWKYDNPWWGRPLCCFCPLASHLFCNVSTVSLRCDNSVKLSHREEVMVCIHLCCFAFPTLQIRYMQVSDAVIVTLPHTDTHHPPPSLHLKLTSKVPRERADGYVIDWGGGVGMGWGGPSALWLRSPHGGSCDISAVIRINWHQRASTSCFMEKINNKHETDKSHPAVFHRRCSLQ